MSVATLPNTRARRVKGTRASVMDAVRAMFTPIFTGRLAPIRPVAPCSDHRDPHALSDQGAEPYLKQARKRLTAVSVLFCSVHRRNKTWR